MFGFSSFAETPFSTLASISSAIILGTASINGYADVSCNANAINSFSASIITPGSVTASASRIYPTTGLLCSGGGGGGGGFTGAQQSFGGNGGSGLCIFICW